MLDGVSLDQLRTFIAAADSGSFSAAGRTLGRAQSVVSQAIANLEGQLGVALFERSARYPTLTGQGAMLLADARAVVGAVTSLKVRAKGMSEGLEPELSIVIDVMFPMRVLTETFAAFGEAFPSTALRLYVEVLGGVPQMVLDRQCTLGIMGTLPMANAELKREALLGVKIVMVAALAHPLAQIRGPVSRDDLARHVQLVLTDRTDLSKGRDFGVFSPRTWRLADLGAKHAFLRAGLGWGGMPFETVARDLEAGELVELKMAEMPPNGLIMPMLAIYRDDSPPGPAGRWLVERLKTFTTPFEGTPCGENAECGPGPATKARTRTVQAVAVALPPR